MRLGVIARNVHVGVRVGKLTADGMMGITVFVLEALRAERLANALVTRDLLAVLALTLAVLRRFQRVLRRREHELGEFNETGSLVLIKLEHQPNDLDDVIGVTLSQLFEARFNKFLAVVHCIFLVEACDIFHASKLEEDETARVNVRLEQVVDDVARVAAILDVRLP